MLRTSPPSFQITFWSLVLEAPANPATRSRKALAALYQTNRF